MTGENFLRVNRHNGKLEKLIKARDEAGHRWAELVHELRDTGCCDMEELYKVIDRCELLEFYLSNMGFNYFRREMNA